MDGKWIKTVFKTKSLPAHNDKRLLGMKINWDTKSRSGAFAWVPFAKLNLLRNPFGELVQEDRIAAAIIDWDLIEPFLNRPRVALQFWGECGHGKTTHLLAILDHLQHAQYVYLAEDEKCPPIPEPAENETLIIDEAQRLPFWTKRRIFKRDAPLILGTHRDFRKHLQRCGYEVHSITFENQLRPERLQEIINRRIELARFQKGDIPQISLQESQKLCHQFGDNIREIESLMFDTFQSMANEKTGTANDTIENLSFVS